MLVSETEVNLLSSLQYGNRMQGSYRLPTWRVNLRTQKSRSAHVSSGGFKGANALVRDLVRDVQEVPVVSGRTVAELNSNRVTSGHG